MDTNRLGTVRKLFRQWQARYGSGKGHAVPDKIRARIVGLLDERSIDEVAGEFGLNRGTVRRWGKNSGQLINSKFPIQIKTARSKQSPEFIEVKGAENSCPVDLTLEWIRRDGNRMRLNGLSVLSSREFINEFLGSGEAR